MEHDMRGFVTEVINSDDFLDAVEHIAARGAAEVENRVSYEFNRALNHMPDHETVQQISEYVLRNQVKDAVFEVLREIGLVDENYMAHEPSEVVEADFDNIAMTPFG